MTDRRDPVERATQDGRDLYDVASWEPRTVLDRLSCTLYAAISYGARGIVVLVTLLITLTLLVPPALVVAEEPVVSVFFALSVVPAALLAAYIWYVDITTNEPLGVLVATFLLSVLFATFAAVINSVGGAFFETTTLVGSLLFFFLIVGPVEETVKLLAVRVYAYRSDTFDSVLDGAVYGAIAGLGFASIENVIYIGGHLTEIGPEAGLYVAATEISTTRALAGPGHVIYSAIAGYYLGLAKFNPTHTGPLVVKGLLIAAAAHATYNTTVGYVPELVAVSLGIGTGLAFVLYVVVYDVAIGYYLYRKIAGYRRVYRAVREDAGDTTIEPEATEFDPPNGSRAGVEEE